MTAPAIVPVPEQAQPHVGESYVDALSGATVKRITDAKASGVAWISQEYSTVSCWNCDNSRLLLIAVDHFQLYDGEGNYIRDLTIDASAQPRWSRTDPGLLYFLRTGLDGKRNQIGIWKEPFVTTARTFPEYASISGMGEGDLSADGDHLALCGFDADGKQKEVFLYTLSTDTKGPVLDVSADPIESLYIDALNRVIVSRKGIDLYDAEMNFLWNLTNANGHKAVTQQDNGQPLIVWTNSNEMPGKWAAFPNGIVAISSGKDWQLRAPLISLDWSLAVHISAPEKAGFVFVSTEQAPNGPAVPYQNEILRVWLDGRVDSICHHRSVIRDYTAQPKVSCSRDGSRFVYASNFGGETVDTYMVVLDAEPAPPAKDALPGFTEE